MGAIRLTLSDVIKTKHPERFVRDSVLEVLTSIQKAQWGDGPYMNTISTEAFYWTRFMTNQ